MNISIPKKHIMVGLSGGVDSSIAAYLLKKEGHHVEAVFMKNWEEDDTDTNCPTSQDLIDAQKVCDLLQINLRLVNFSDEYWKNVFTYFLDEYRLGRTPNPDILCNKEIKFTAFLNYAKQYGVDAIATGHYGRLQYHDKGASLLKGFDPQKDQSYFLYALNQQQLFQSLFPVGHLPKTKVRQLAKELGFSNHAKKDSTGICFIGERKFKNFLSEYLPTQCGNIETPQGEVIGKHDGLMFYTMGQRQGLQIGGLKGKPENAWYVAHKDIQRNVLIVVQNNEHPLLFKKTLIASQLHWINSPPSFPLHAKAKTRYRQPDQHCRIEAINDSSCHVTFNSLQRAITPGQSIVFYQDAICLGGGIIEG